MPIAAGRLRALIPATTSIDAIIERTGGSKRTIYSEFGSKEGLFLSIGTEYSPPLLVQYCPPDYGLALGLPDAGRGCKG